MADQSAIRIHNIVSITQGANRYVGVRSVTIQADKGKLMPILEEGNLYASGAENVGLPQFPVTVQATFETDTERMLGLIAEAVGNLVIVVKQTGGGADKTITIENHQFRNFSKAQNLQDYGRPSVKGEAFSSDGATLPITVA